MKKLKMFCLCLNNQHLKKIEKLNYIPVGLGNENFSSKFLRDNTKKNISWKNKSYGEYTFHYWFWKNMLRDIKNNTWIGFCAYRRFWQIEKKKFAAATTIQQIRLRRLDLNFAKERKNKQN